ncbi:hypothetical protein ACFYV7_14830 [Nocardia suismassiliense]|uniref:Uncharacterized protein n=1 Tax=Nocardia suismassiliense TaxID=2077092 RepID=A0ABW6QSE5_9NOCA
MPRAKRSAELQLPPDLFGRFRAEGAEMVTAAARSAAPLRRSAALSLAGGCVAPTADNSLAVYGDPIYL